MSWFEGHSKVFIKMPVNNIGSLEKMQAKILKDKKPKYPLHCTLSVIHVAKETPYTTYFNSTDFKEDLLELYPQETHFLETGNVKFDLMGNNPECFTLVIDTGDVFKTLVSDFKERLCLFLCEKHSLTRSERLFNEKYNYIVLTSVDGLEVLKMPFSDEHPPVCHITLFTLFDLNRCNKPLFKEYQLSINKLKFLSRECGDDAATLLV